jgi:hypothetical protein
MVDIPVWLRDYENEARDPARTPVEETCPLSGGDCPRDTSRCTHC